MGLGKTGQTIALLQWLKENQYSNIPQEPETSLVVCPLSVLNAWIAEVKRWAPQLRVLRFHGPANERDRLKKFAKGFLGPAPDTNLCVGMDNYAPMLNSASKNQSNGVDLIVTTYETYVSEVTWFRSALAFRYVVLDEGHKIKNAKCSMSKTLQSIKAEYRLVLTGTPIQNDMKELWSLLHW